MVMLGSIKCTDAFYDRNNIPRPIEIGLLLVLSQCPDLLYVHVWPRFRQCYSRTICSCNRNTVYTAN